MTRKRGLGRGLDALLSGAAAVHSAEGARELRELPLDLIRRNRFQPRRLMDPQALEELARSIRSRGVVQPVVVRPDGDGQHFELVAGDVRQTVKYDARTAVSGWNDIGTFELPAGPVSLEVSDSTDGNVVVADAVRWQIVGDAP